MIQDTAFKLRAVVFILILISLAVECGVSIVTCRFGTAAAYIVALIFWIVFFAGHD
jgi:hypothetical protein